MGAAVHELFDIVWSIAWKHMSARTHAHMHVHAHPSAPFNYSSTDKLCYSPQMQSSRFCTNIDTGGGRTKLTTITLFRKNNSSFYVFPGNNEARHCMSGQRWVCFADCQFSFEMTVMYCTTDSVQRALHLNQIISEFTSMPVQTLKYRGKTSLTLQNQLLHF